MQELLRSFLETEGHTHGPIYNERSFQLELGLYLRAIGYRIEFERPFDVGSGEGMSRRQKRNLDILAIDQSGPIAIELKVPLSGRVPETMYDFCADIAFVESIVHFGKARFGLCVLLTSDPLFWQRGTPAVSIYGYFRTPGTLLSGIVGKPTGSKDTTVAITGKYNLASAWSDCGNTQLMKSGRYIVVEIGDKSALSSQASVLSNT